MTDEIQKLSKGRLSKAQVAWEEARATKGLDSSKHSGAISLFHEHFVRTNLVNPEKAKAFSRAFEKRQDSDYEDFASVTGEEALKLKNEVEAFIQECEKVLKLLIQKL